MGGGGVYSISVPILETCEANVEDGEEDGHQMHEEVHSIQPETEPRWPLQGPHAKTTFD